MIVLFIEKPFDFYQRYNKICFVILTYHKLNRIITIFLQSYTNSILF